MPRCISEVPRGHFHGVHSLGVDGSLSAVTQAAGHGGTRRRSYRPESGSARCTAQGRRAAWGMGREQAPKAAPSRPPPPRCPSCRGRQGGVCWEGSAAESLDMRVCPYEL